MEEKIMIFGSVNKEGRFEIYGVYANGELANMYFDINDAEMAVDDLLELGVDAELEVMSVII